jgi:quinoprotein relay system zinc metallohydrolase 2
MLLTKLKSLRISLCIALFFLCLCSSISIHASSDNAATFSLDEIAPGVYVHYGKHVEFDDSLHDDIANIGFIVGDKCVAVIDTGGSVRTGQGLLSAIRKTTSKPICFVINTHIHFDHILGNIVFQNDQVKFVGHKNLEEEVIASRAFFLQRYRNDLGDSPTENSIVGPNQSVEDSNMQIDLGNRILDLTAYNSAHSHSDISVYDRRSKSLWLSDLLFVQRIPALDGSLKGWLDVVEGIKKSPAERFIPGHGPVSPGSSSALADLERYLQTLLSQTRKKIAEGLFMEDIVDSVGNSEKQFWLLHEQHHKRNVTKAFSELEWE